MSLTALRAGFLVCRACELVNRPTADGHRGVCSRCGEALRWRKPESLARSWIFLALAAILYVPANVLPVLHSVQLGATQSNTILGGVRVLWQDGDFMIASVIFVASIVVPAAKILLLASLLVSASARSTQSPMGRTKVYRVVETIGRWSMVDIFVGAVLVALVQFKTVGEVSAGPAALPFAAVVVLTMFAAMSFDPRLIWDPLEQARG
ncbi:MAG TPA: paraquat-inducible protein A [Usitatibacter sp.]|jgi:paraquat-inducible protein A|nr:paraquat-inducible protein A [Usitatibacter sp.]